MSAGDSQPDRARPRRGRGGRLARRRAEPRGTRGQRRRCSSPGAAESSSPSERSAAHYGGPAGRGAGGGRHRPLPMAPRLLLASHRRGAARPGAQPRRPLDGGAARLEGRTSPPRPRRSCSEEGLAPRRRGGSSSSAAAQRATPRRSCSGARGSTAASPCSAPTPRSPTTGPTSPRTTWPAPRRRSGSRSARPSSTPSRASSCASGPGSRPSPPPAAR